MALDTINNSETKMSKRSRSITLSQYVLRRNGVPLGAPGSLQNMMMRAFGARSFATFWRYWNPIFGYYLSRYIYSPATKILPSSLALILTFVLCGALHDLVTMAVRGAPAFLFTPWFFFLGAGVLVGESLTWDCSNQPWIIRAGIDSLYVTLCMVITLGCKILW